MMFRVTADKALFTDPLTRLGGEKCSYEIPTYGALVGVCKAIYWKPTFLWVIDKVRIMTPIELHSEGVKLPHYEKEGTDLANYCYIVNPEYEVTAHMEWNLNHPELEDDRIKEKHETIAIDALERGGRRDVYLGTKECLAYVEPCQFGKKAGYYDNLQKKEFGIMYHSIVHADEAFSEKTKGHMTVLFHHPVMQHGVIHFVRPDEIPPKYMKRIRKMSIKTFEKPETET